VKEKLALVIAVVMITATAFATLTTTVTAYTNQATVSIAQTSVRDNALVLITLTVTNPSAGENVENIVIKDVTTGVTSFFSNPFGGNENVAENWDNIADNLIAVGDNMVFVRDNFLNAVAFIDNAGKAMVTASHWENEAGIQLFGSGENTEMRNAGSYLKIAAGYWKLAGEGLQSELLNFKQIAENLENAALKERWAGSAIQSMEDNGASGAGYYDNAGDNIANAANWLDNLVAENLENTLIAAVGDNLWNIAIAWENAGAHLGRSSDVAVDLAADYIENYMANKLYEAAENLRRAALALENAGLMLENIADEYLENARWILARYARDVGGTSNPGTDNFLDVDAVENVMNAGLNLDLRPVIGTYENYDNILSAGENLKNAAASLDVANWLGPLFASDIIGFSGEVSTTTARYYIDKAGENMDNKECINLTTVANNLYSAGQRLVAAGNKLKTTKALLAPTTGWGLETGGVAGTNGLLISPIRGENRLTAGNSLTVSFFWQAPDISAEEAHTFRVWTFKQDNTASTSTDFTVTVDGLVAKGSMVITQTGVTWATSPYVVGRVYDNQCTITVTATEVLSTIGQVYIENWKGTGEIVAGPFTLTSTDNIVWAYTVDTTSWLDNWENLKVRVAAPWASDLLGLENTENLIDNLIFDTRPPILIDNGMDDAGELGALENEMKPGTTTTYRRTNDKAWTINVRVEDNTSYGAVQAFGNQADNAGWCTVVILQDNTETSTTQTPDDNWEAEAVFADGVGSITVRVTDRVGNSVENVLTNVYIDNTAPTVEFVSVAGQAWTDNSLRISDNGIDGGLPIVLRIHDAGWGIVINAGGNVGSQYDNLWVYLDNDDNLANGENILLENLGVWDNGAVGTFENTYENIVSGIAKGLRSGYWWVIVKVGDNVRSQAGSHVDNENYSQRFCIDVTKPTAPSTTAMSSTLAAGTLSLPTTTTLSSVTIAGTGVAGDTLKVYTTTDGVTWTEQAAYAATVNTAGEWSVTVSLTTGQKLGLGFTFVDAALNESSRAVWGYVLLDASAPTVTITSPETGVTTDQTTIVVTGTIVKDGWEVYSALTSSVQIGSAAAGSLTVDSAGNFEVSATLGEGTNTITISVTDAAGNIGSSVVSVTRTVTPWATYAIIIVIVALILAAIAIFRKR